MYTLNHAVRLGVVGVLALAASLQAQSFDIMFRVSSLKGTCQVKTPGRANFEAALNGKAYPFGTIIRTGEDGSGYIVLSQDDTLRMSSLCEVAVSGSEDSPVGPKRVVRLEAGRLEIAVREGLAEKALIVETGVASCDGFAGHSSLELQKNQKSAKDKLDLRLLARTDNGVLHVYGPQFNIPKLRSGAALRIESSTDRSITRLINEAGDYKVEIDNGTDTPDTLDSTARSTVRISREQAAVGGKLAVFVLETVPDGKGRELRFVLGEPSLTASGLPATAEEHSNTGGVVTATSPTVSGATTNAPSKEESLK